MHISTTLEQLGYPLNQVQIYLAALKMGESVVSDIAEHVNMPRSTATELLEELHKHGLMNYYVRKGRKYWVAENPDKLMIHLKEREAALQSILPQLHAMQFTSGEGKPSVRTYVGATEVRNIYSDLIETKHHIMGLVSWDDVLDFFGDEFMKDFIERRSAHFLRLRLLTPKTKLSLVLKSKDNKELRQTKFLPEHLKLGRISNFIYGGKVATISMNRKVPTGIIVQDPDIADAQMIYFESLWQQSSEK